MTPAGRILLGAGIALGVVALVPIALLASGAFRLMYMPSESMMPTMALGDRFAVRMSRPEVLSRGDLVLVRASGNSLYVKRIAGLPGDRIELVGGIVQLNGHPVAQRLLGVDPVAPDAFGSTARRLEEQFPGEAAPHQIYDSGESSGDDFPAQTVAPGHYFLLGDNRDHSADSRFPREEEGLEQVALDDIRGVPLFFYMSSRRRFGDDAGH